MITSQEFRDKFASNVSGFDSDESARNLISAYKSITEACRVFIELCDALINKIQEVRQPFSLEFNEFQLLELTGCEAQLDALDEYRYQAAMQIKSNIKTLKNFRRLLRSGQNADAETFHLKSIQDFIVKIEKAIETDDALREVVEKFFIIEEPTESVEESMWSDSFESIFDRHDKRIDLYEEEMEKLLQAKKYYSDGLNRLEKFEDKENTGERDMHKKISSQIKQLDQYIDDAKLYLVGESLKTIEGFLKDNKPDIWSNVSNLYNNKSVWSSGLAKKIFFIVFRACGENKHFTEMFAWYDAVGQHLFFEEDDRKEKSDFVCELFDLLKKFCKSIPYQTENFVFLTRFALIVLTNYSWVYQPRYPEVLESMRQRAETDLNEGQVGLIKEGALFPAPLACAKEQKVWEQYWERNVQIVVPKKLKSSITPTPGVNHFQQGNGGANSGNTNSIRHKK